MVGQIIRLQLQFLQNAIQLSTLYQVEARLERRQQLLGHRPAGVRNAHIATDLEIAYADGAAPLLQS